MSKERLYKNTNLPWCPQIPNDWELKKFNRIAFYQEGPGLRNWQFTNEGIKVICVTNITENGIDFSKLTRNISVEEYNKIYKHFTVKKGDYLLASSGASWGKVAEYKDDETVILNTSTIRLNTLNEKELSRGFLQWIIKSSYISENLNILLTGSCQPNFGPTHLSQLYVAIPKNINEQEKISEYLNNKTTEINNLISKKQKLIDCLKEERMAIINQAVTKGINPNAEMKESGIEWLGDIPKHWEIKKLKYIGQSIIGITYNPNEVSSQEEGILVLRASNVQDAVLSFDDNVFVNKEIQEKQITKEGDILICARNGSAHLIGKCAYIPKEYEGVTFGAFMLIYRSNIGKYMYYVFNSELFKSQSGLFKTSTINQLTAETINNMYVPITYNIDEQEEIVEFLNKETKKIDDVIFKVSQEIDLIKEYRTSLINEVVTGKITLN